MPNLIAYIPVLNKRYYDWLKKYPDSNLYLISQEQAADFVPRLSRMRIIGLSSKIIASMIENEQLVSRVFYGIDCPCFLFEGEILMPDEDVCHAFAEINIDPKKAKITFESIWARWDMTAVKREQPVQLGLKTITRKKFFEEVVSRANKEAAKSPDWWRQVGASIFNTGNIINYEILSCGYNEHFPTEYEQDAMGDPRLNYEAGQKGKYLSLHAERFCIAECAQKGLATMGASIFVTCFPCEDCAREIVKAGIKLVYFEEGYSSLGAQDIFDTYNVSVIKVIE